MPDRRRAGEARLLVAEVHEHGAGDGEVALVHVVRPGQGANPLHHLRHREVHVGVALAVDVGDLVHRRTASPDLDVLPVLRIEAAQEDLMRLSLPAVLGDEYPRDHRQEITAALVGRSMRHVALDGRLAGGAGFLLALHADGYTGIFFRHGLDLPRRGRRHAWVLRCCAARGKDGARTDENG